MPQLCNLVKTAAVDVGNFVRIPLFLDMTQSFIREEQNPLLIRYKNLKLAYKLLPRQLFKPVRDSCNIANRDFVYSVACDIGLSIFLTLTCLTVGVESYI